MKNLIRHAIIILLPLALPTVAEDTPAEATEAQTKRCISMTRISNAEVIDDQTIAFHMTGRDVYLNRLPRRCPSMHVSRTIGYRTHAGQLCNLDTVTVLDNLGGISRGPTCGLGMFSLISKDELKALKAERRKGADKEKDEQETEASGD